MIDFRPPRLLQRSGATARAFALAALVPVSLALTGPAAAQEPFDVTVYHAFDDETGADPRPTSSAPPGCQITGGGGGVTIDFEGFADGQNIHGTNLGGVTATAPSGFVMVLVNSSDASYHSPVSSVISASYEEPLIFSFDSPQTSVGLWAGDSGGDLDSWQLVAFDAAVGGAVVDTAQQPADDWNGTPYTYLEVSGPGILRVEASWLGPSAPVAYDDLSFSAAGVECIIHGSPNEELDLWIDGGPSASGDEEICMLGEGGGSGDELCGADILLQLSGVGKFRRFVPDAGMSTLVYKPDCVFDEEAEQCLLPPDTTQLRLNFLSGLSTPGTGPRRIGALFVDSTGLDESTPTSVTAFGEAAGAQLQARPIASPADPEVVAVSSVPEPGAMLQLASGLLGLVCLYRLRRRS
jgi:hypothetical protein